MWQHSREPVRLGWRSSCRSTARPRSTIPAGEYGGGTVMIWDRGTWKPESADVDGAFETGQLKFTLFGEKLHGSWVLVRLRARAGQKRVAWLLIKHRDE